MTRLLRHAHARLRCEEGMALLLALVAMVVLGIMMTSLIAYSSATSRDTYLKRSDLSASSLADAALNQGLAQLASHYLDSSNNLNNTSTAFASSSIIPEVSRNTFGFSQIVTAL